MIREPSSSENRSDCIQHQRSNTQGVLVDNFWRVLTFDRNKELTNYTKDQITAFRLEAHHLSDRLPPGSLVQATGACGIQNTPPGSADLALHARVADLKPGDLEQALISKKSLLQAWSLRASPYIFPTSDATVFLTGILPQTEEGIRSFIRGVIPALDQIGIRAEEVIKLAATALVEEFVDGFWTKDELGIALAGRAAEKLSKEQLQSWQGPSPYADDQTLGESVIRFVLPVLSLKGLLCHAERRGGKAYLKLTEDWLGEELPCRDKQKESAELLRRYMRCFGPSKVEHFSEWAGISPKQAGRIWKDVHDKYVEAGFEGRTGWLHHEDVPRLDMAKGSTGVRFLPPHDPYLQLRDRETIVSDKRFQRQIWKLQGNPGVLLVDGNVVGVWHPKKKGSLFEIKVELFEEISSRNYSLIDAEAQSIAPFRGCSKADVKVES